MEDWKISRVEYINRKRGELSRAREACSEEQLRSIQEVLLALQNFEWEFNETICAGGSADDIPVGSYTRVLKAGSELAQHWHEPPMPDFYDDVMELKRQETAEEIQSFEQLYEDLNNLSCVKRKACVSCGKALKGRQKKLCGKKKCKDAYYAKK